MKPNKEELEKLGFEYLDNRDCWLNVLDSGIEIEYFTDASYWLKSFSDTTIMMVKSIEDLKCIIRVFN